MNSNIAKYINLVKSGEINACEDQRLLIKHVEDCFENEDIYTDDEQLEKYLGLSKYFPFDEIFEWEVFCLGLHLCTYKANDNRPRWPHLVLLIGRGAGKDGYIALESFCLVSPYNPIKSYDVDICANAEEQAMRPVNDILEVLDDARWNRKLKKHYKWTKEKIVGIKGMGTIKGRTNNPGSKDGMRSGMIAFNEIHQYPDYKNIKVFMTGLGKKKHPRILYATTNGDIRQGPLDDLAERSNSILKLGMPDKGLLPFICKLDDKKEAHNPDMWEKANPSLRFLPDLMEEIKTEYDLWVENPLANTDFMTKRMNLPQAATDVVVTKWENIIASNQEMPDLTGRECTCGIDYASISDFASVNLHFRLEDIRCDISHSWLCLNSKDLHRIKAPYKEWAEAGMLTLVDEVEIRPDLLCEWILEMGSKYYIRKMALDNFRYALMTNSLKKIGFDANERKNIKLVRPSDIMKVQPTIESCFNNQQFVWGDNPVLRWATNNTKLITSGKKQGTDTGNFYYGKIEGKSRKTDPFMALVASMTLEDELSAIVSGCDNLPVIMG